MQRIHPLQIFAENIPISQNFYYFRIVMKKILRIDNPNVYAEYVGAPMLHPQLALISFDEVSPFRSRLFKKITGLTPSEFLRQ